MVEGHHLNNESILSYYGKLKHRRRILNGFFLVLPQHTHQHVGSLLDLFPEVL